jgi:hypothetical protein
VADLLHHRRGGDEQLLRRLGEAPNIGGPDKSVKLMRVHGGASLPLVGCSITHERDIEKIEPHSKGNFVPTLGLEERQLFSSSLMAGFPVKSL